MSNPLDDPRFKVARANEHLYVLIAEINGFLASRPFVVERELGPESGVYRFRARVRQLPPPQIGLLIGDCLHNLRSALDHLAYQLAMTYSGSAGGSEFPIFNDPDKFAQRTKHGDPALKSGLAKIRYCAPQAQALIEQLQPYHGGNVAHLWMLHELANIDKHRTIPVHSSIFPNMVLFHENWELVFDETRPPWTIVDGQEIARFRLHGSLTPELENPAFDLLVAFAADGPARGRPVLEAMMDLYNFVRADVLPTFEQFFPTISS